MIFSLFFGVNPFLIEDVERKPRKFNSIDQMNLREKKFPEIALKFIKSTMLLDLDDRINDCASIFYETY